MKLNTNDGTFKFENLLLKPLLPLNEVEKQLDNQNLLIYFDLSLANNNWKTYWLHVEKFENLYSLVFFKDQLDSFTIYPKILKGDRSFHDLTILRNLAKEMGSIGKYSWGTYGIVNDPRSGSTYIYISYNNPNSSLKKNFFSSFIKKCRYFIQDIFWI